MLRRHRVDKKGSAERGRRIVLLTRAQQPRPGSRGRELGQAITEFALVVPVLLLMFAAAADFGRAFYAYVAIENAVKEGALFGAQRPICDDDSATGCANPANVTWRVRNETDLKNPDGTDLAPTVSCLDRTTNTPKAILNCAEGDSYVVALTYQFRLLTPIASSIVGSTLNLGAEARAVVLNLAFDPTPGISVQKLIQASTARNGSEIVATCLEPDDADAEGYYRSPCRNSTDNNNPVHLTYQAGDTIRYKVTVRNTGAQVLSGVAITDSVGWPATTADCPARPSTLALGATYTCIYTRTAPAPAGSATTGEYINQATADATNVEPATVAVTAKVELPPADLRVVKAVSPYELGSDGDGSPSFGTTSSLDIAFNTQVPTPSVWYQITVRNSGGQAATGLTVTDTAGPLATGTATCPTIPSSLAAGAEYVCRYNVPYTTAGMQSTAATATATNVTPGLDDTSAVAVTVTACTGATNRVVPSLIGLTAAAAQTAWTSAQFAGALTAGGFSSSSVTVAQNVQAYSCLPQTTTMTISRTSTP
jgi:uncharacterized repeat protein (TIGR01451 family)